MEWGRTCQEQGTGSAQSSVQRAGEAISAPVSKENRLTVESYLNEHEGLVGGHGVGVLTTTSPGGTVGPVSVSYVLAESGPYVRAPHGSELLTCVAENPRVSLWIGTSVSDNIDRDILVRGVASIAEGFERAVRLAAEFDPRFRDLLPPPLSGDANETDDASAILRITPSAAPISATHPYTGS